MEDYSTRYARHYSLKNFGQQGQQKLAAAKVLVIGAGGLGCPVLQYLAAAGVGNIGIVDNDTVALSNLQRQVLYSTNDVGSHKVDAAKQSLGALNPEIAIETYKLEITALNALDIIRKYDVIADCTDNFAARYLINDACVLLNKPLIFGAVYQYEGQVAVFNVTGSDGNTANYRHLFAMPPDPLEVADCNEAGVLGMLPGVIGVMQATEVLKLLTGVGEVLANKLLTFSLLDYVSFVIEISADVSVNNLIPKDEASFMATDYKWLCGLSLAGITELGALDFLGAVNNPDTIVIDVREPHEQPKADFTNLNIPLSALDKKLSELSYVNIVLFCQSGKRSLKAAEMLLNEFGTSKKISHLKGGIISLQEK